MTELQNELRGLVAQLLAEGEIGYCIGWGSTRFAHKTAPLFVFQEAEAQTLVCSPDCRSMLASYLLDDRYPKGKIGLCVRGCESRAVNRMLADGQIERENLYLIGLPCHGAVDEAGQPLEKCALCTHRNPVIFDRMLGEPAPEPQAVDRFARVEELERLSPDEKYEYWAEAFDRCIRCYACRNVCPACNCTKCYVDAAREGWQGKQHSRDENQIYGLTRAYHVGPRCVECGECERVCPMHLPLMSLNRKLIKDINELFGPYEGGLDVTSKNALGTFLKDDLEEFM